MLIVSWGAKNVLGLLGNTCFYTQNRALGVVLAGYKRSEWFSIGVAFLAFFYPINISKCGRILK